MKKIYKHYKLKMLNHLFHFIRIYLLKGNILSITKKINEDNVTLYIKLKYPYKFNYLDRCYAHYRIRSTLLNLNSKGQIAWILTQLVRDVNNNNILFLCSSINIIDNKKFTGYINNVNYKNIAKVDISNHEFIYIFEIKNITDDIED